MPNLVDTHCHLDFAAFDEDREAVIQRAEENLVKRIVIPSVDLKSAENIQKLCEKIPTLFAAVGVHPNSATGWNKTKIQMVKNLSQHPKVVAIGEIGLDYFWENTPTEVQKEAFLDHLDIAEQVNKPVIIHNREATRDVMEHLSRWVADLQKKGSPLAERPGVLHSFSADVETAKIAVGLNFYIGFTGPVTFKKADQLRDVVKNVPIENILIETDAPFLTPHPYRGKRNEPSHVRFVAEKIAEITGLPFETIAETTTKNAERLFGWSVKD